jgi:CelD/BcsL family acetyltransferase involved in cellulose biosynthesis
VPLTVASSEPVIERHTEIGPLADEWDSLADRAGAPPFMRPGWFEAWLEAFTTHRFDLIAARQDGYLTGVLPLLRSRGGVLRAPANSHTPLGGALVDGSEAAAALARTVLDERAARIDFRYADPADPFLAHLRASGRRLIERTVSEQPWVDTSSGDFDAYLAGLARKHRKEAGRLRRKLEAAGELSFELADGLDGRLEELLVEGFAIEGSGWKTENGTAINSLKDAQTFYRRLSRWAAERGYLRLAFLRLDGRALAFDLCLEAGGSFYALKGGFDVEFRSLGPGVVLTYESIRRAFESEALHAYEFLGTSDEYKLQWTSATRPRVRFQVFSRSPLGLLQYAGWQHGRPLAKRLKRS